MKLSVRLTLEVNRQSSDTDHEPPEAGHKPNGTLPESPSLPSVPGLDRMLSGIGLSLADITQRLMRMERREGSRDLLTMGADVAQIWKKD